MQDENNVAEKEIVEGDTDAVNIAKLLDAVNTRVFDDHEDLLRKDQPFEKVSSFFDLIKSSGDDELKNLEGEKEKTQGDVNRQIDVNDIGNTTQDEGGAEKENESAAEQEPDSTVAESQKDKTVDNLISNTEEDEGKGAVDKELEISDPENLEDDNKNSSTSDEGINENFEPIDVIENSLEAAQKFERESGVQPTDNEENSPEFELGYQTALKEFEATLEAEKEAISKFASSLLSIRDDYALLIESLMKEKIIEISREFLGKNIDSFPEDFCAHLKNVSKSIVNEGKDLIVQLNEIDASALKTVIETADFPIIFEEVTDLGRGEFRMFAGKSGYEQKVSD
jgi:hypothetical protein